VGRKAVFCAGVVVMVAGSLCTFTAGSIGAVIVGQLLSGVGGALILPNSLAVLGATFTDPHRRTEVITAWSASSGVGLAVGPLLAGVLVQHYSWHAVFLSNTVLGVITLAVTIPFVAESTAPARLDIAGAALATVTIATLVFGLIQGGSHGYRSGSVVAAWAVTVIAAVAFVIVENRRATPMVDPRLFRSRSFSTVMTVAAVSLFGFTGVALLTVLYLERVRHLSVLGMGEQLFVYFATYVVVAFAAGPLIRRTGFKAPLTVGLLLGAAASLGLAAASASSPYSHLWPWLALSGAASGLVAPPSTAAALVSVTPQQAGMASGAVNAARQVGSVMGSSVLGMVLTQTFVSALPGQLAAHGVAPPARASVTAAVASGTTSTTLLPDGARAAIDQAFASGVHVGFQVNAIVFLVTAVGAFCFVLNRPHETRQDA
jgi:DHA2 family multidrug resistance protein-like MFS transporter